MFAVFTNETFEHIIKDEELPFWQSSNDHSLFFYKINEDQISSTLQSYNIQTVDIDQYFDFILNINGSLMITPNVNLINIMAARRMELVKDETMQLTKNLLENAKEEMHKQSIEKEAYFSILIDNKEKELSTKWKQLSFWNRVKAAFLKELPIE